MGRHRRDGQIMMYSQYLSGVDASAANGAYPWVFALGIEEAAKVRDAYLLAGKGTYVPCFGALFLLNGQVQYWLTRLFPCASIGGEIVSMAVRVPVEYAQLSERQREYCLLRGQLYTNKEIQVRLDVSPRSIGNLRERVNAITGNNLREMCVALAAFWA